MDEMQVVEAARDDDAVDEGRVVELYDRMVAASEASDIAAIIVEQWLLNELEELSQRNRGKNQRTMERLRADDLDEKFRRKWARTCQGSILKNGDLLELSASHTSVVSESFHLPTETPTFMLNPGDLWLLSQRFTSTVAGPVRSYYRRS